MAIRAELTRLRKQLPSAFGINSSGNCDCGHVELVIWEGNDQDDPIPERCPRCGGADPNVRLCLVEVVERNEAGEIVPTAEQPNFSFVQGILDNPETI